MSYDKRALVGKKVLIVEDHPAYSENTMSYLQALGLEVISTRSLLGALNVVSKSKESFDIALIDIYLPLEDGGIDRQNMGIYLAAIIKMIWIDVPVVGISNYVEEIPEGLISVFSDVLKKREVFMQRNGLEKLLDTIYSNLTSSDLESI